MFIIFIMFVKGCTLLGSGIAIISISGSGVGIGILFGNLLLAMAKAPKMEKVLFSYAILGFALTEAIALMGVMVSMTILFDK